MGICLIQFIMLILRQFKEGRNQARHFRWKKRKVLYCVFCVCLFVNFVFNQAKRRKQGIWNMVEDTGLKLHHELDSLRGLKAQISGL